jgi:preprotein translocase subunit YajC
VESVGALLPFVLILLAFYVLIIRPARNRQRAQSRLADNLQVGQKVITTSGLYAEIAAVEDDAIVLETSPGVTQRWAKPAVARILTETDEAGSLDETQSLDEPESAESTDETTGTGDGSAPAAHDSTSSLADPDTTGKRPE